MTSIELENSVRGTQRKGDRLKERPIGWRDKVASLETRNCSGRYADNAPYEGFCVDFVCERIQRFWFTRNDYLKIIKAMLSVLPLESLVKINKLLARLIEENVKQEFRKT